MWYPTRGQWAAIWVGFALGGWCFFWGNDRPYFGTEWFRPKEYRTLGWLVVIATALVVWWLNSRRRPKGN